MIDTQEFSSSFSSLAAKFDCGKHFALLWNAHRKRCEFVDKLFCETAFSYRRNENFFAPHNADRSPTYRHNVVARTKKRARVERRVQAR